MPRGMLAHRATAPRLAVSRCVRIAFVAGRRRRTGCSPDAPPDAGACGLRAGPRGMSQRTMMVAGLQRTYIVYLPDGVRRRRRCRSCSSTTATRCRRRTCTTSPATPRSPTREHIAVVFPDGQAGPNSLGAPWNVGTNICPSTSGTPPEATGDDFAFLDAMKADVSAGSVPRSRPRLRHRVLDGRLLLAPRRLRARRYPRASRRTRAARIRLDDCPVAKKPIIIFHGAADPLIPAGLRRPGCGAVPGVTPSAARGPRTTAAARRRPPRRAERHAA